MTLQEDFLTESMSFFWLNQKKTLLDVSNELKTMEDLKPSFDKRNPAYQILYDSIKIHHFNFLNLLKRLKLKKYSYSHVSPILFDCYLRQWTKIQDVPSIIEVSYGKECKDYEIMVNYDNVTLLDAVDEKYEGRQSKNMYFSEIPVDLEIFYKFNTFFKLWHVSARRCYPFPSYCGFFNLQDLKSSIRIPCNPFFYSMSASDLSGVVCGNPFPYFTSLNKDFKPKVLEIIEGNSVEIKNLRKPNNYRAFYDLLSLDNHLVPQNLNIFLFLSKLKHLPFHLKDCPVKKIESIEDIKKIVSFFGFDLEKPYNDLEIKEKLTLIQRSYDLETQMILSELLRPIWAILKPGMCCMSTLVEEFYFFNGNKSVEQRILLFYDLIQIDVL